MEHLAASAISVAKTVGYDSLKDMQMKVIEAFLTGNDLFAIRAYIIRMSARIV